MTTTWTWQLTADEFTRLWREETNQDRFPFPVNRLLRGTTSNVSTQAAVDVTKYYAADDYPELCTALRHCLTPKATQATVTATHYVHDQPRHATNASLSVIFGGMATILHVKPSEITVISCPASEFGRTIVALIGSATPGQHPSISENRTHLLDPDALAWNAQAALRHRNRAWAQLRHPIHTRGDIDIAVGSARPPQPTSRQVSWLDLRDDGRYLLNSGAEVHLTPVADHHVAQHLNYLADLPT